MNKTEIVSCATTYKSTIIKHMYKLKSRQITKKRNENGILCVSRLQIGLVQQKRPVSLLADRPFYYY